MKKVFSKILPWIILVLVIGGLGAWYFLSQRVTQDEISQYDGIVKEAEAFFEVKEYSQAIRKYQDASEIIPSRLRAYEGIVDILLLKSRVNDATEIIGKSARALSSNDRSILFGKVGNYYYSRGDYSKAKDIYQDSLGLGVNNMSSEFMLAKTLLKLGKIQEARAELNKGGYPEELVSEVTLLLAYIDSVTDTGKAKSLLSSVTPSEDWKPYFDEFSQVLNTLDDNVKYNATKLSRIYLNNGFPYLAISLLEPLEQDIAEYLDALYFLGKAYYQVGEWDKSIATLEKALTLGGLESDIFWLKGRVYLHLTDLDGSIRSYQRALDYAGVSVSQDLVNEYVDILLDNEQTLKAQDVVRKLLLVKGDPYLLLLGLRIEYLMKDNQKIDYYVSQLAKKDMSEVEKMEYLYWKATVLLDREESNGVDTILEELLAFSKYNPKYYLLKGRLDILNGKNDDGLKALEVALEYDLDSSITQEASALLSNTK